MLALVIPWFDSGCEYRSKNFEFVKTYYRNFPMFFGSGPSRGLARNDGAEQAAKAGYETIALVDADMLVAPRQLEMAAKVAQVTETLVFAYDSLTRLNRGQTKTALRGIGIQPTKGQAEAGAFVIQTESFQRVHGFPHLDSLEDAFFFVVCNSLLGPPVRVSGNAFHLWHPEGDHTGSIRSRQLLAKFETATPHPRRMEALLKETREYESTRHW